MKKIQVLGICLLVCLLVGCNSKTNLTQYSKTELDCGFDTICSLNAFSKSEEEFDEYFNTMVEEFRYYHKLFDIYHNYEGLNNIKTINDNAGIKAIEVDPVIIELIDLSKAIYDLSGGAFDISDGALLKVWHNYRDAGKDLNANGEYGDIPENSELEEASLHHGFDKIEIDYKANTVYINDPDVSLDVGGVAKGFAVEKVAKTLKEMGISNAAVNAGGNQRLIDGKADGTGWNVGIQDPRAASIAGVVTNSNIAIIPDQKDVAVVTSGDYQNYYIAKGDLVYSHIIDPHTLFPADKYNSVTIVCKDSGLADCLSTSLFVMDYEEGLEFIDKINEAYDDDIVVIWVSDEMLDDSSIKSISEETQYITVTDNFKDKLITSE